MRNIVATLAVFTAVLSAPLPASAGQPGTQTLTPSPPGFLTCKAIGSGTICRGVRTYAYSPVDTGIVCGEGASAFDIFDQGVVDETATWFYDTDGNLNRVMLHENYRSGEWSNPLTGKSVSYRQITDAREILSTPGDFDTVVITDTGQIHIRLGTGAPLLIATGRQVYSSHGDLLASAGRNAFVAAFFQGDTHVFDKVCAALA